MVKGWLTIMESFSIFNFRFQDKVKSMNITEKEGKSLQSYLQKKLGNNNLKVMLPKRQGQPVELCIQEGKTLESIGTVYRDEDEGEISYAISMTILEEDLV